MLNNDSVKPINNAEVNTFVRQALSNFIWGDREGNSIIEDVNQDVNVKLRESSLLAKKYFEASIGGFWKKTSLKNVPVLLHLGQVNQLSERRSL